MDDEMVVSRLIAARAEREPDRTMVNVVDGVDYSNAAFHEGTLRWADGLWTAGVRRDDVVATMLPTSIDAYLCWIGLSWLRAPDVPVNTDFKGPSLTYILNNSGAKVIVVAEQFVQRLADVAGDLTSLQTVVVRGSGRDVPALPFRVILDGEFFEVAKRAPYESPEYYDTHSIIYTSGTTGMAKGVLQPWGGIQVMTEGIFPEDRAHYDDPAVFSCWPTFHTAGRCGLVTAAQRDMRFVLRESFSLSKFWSEIRRYGCTHTMLLVVSGLLMGQPELPSDRDNPLARVGQFPLIPAYREFERRFDVRVSHSYGLSEAGWITAVADPKNYRTSGRPLPGWHIRVVNEIDEEVPIGVTGEIVIRHDRPWRMTKGYLGMPQATADSWRNGWFHTGDAGKFDEDGDLYFVDRMKDSLRHRGHNVSSIEVEIAVLRHPDVAECACIGVSSDLADPDNIVSDQDIKIFVVPRVDAELTTEVLHEFLAEDMPRFMLPRYVKFVSELPRTPTNKVRKAELRALSAGDDHGWDSWAGTRRGRPE